MFDDLTSISLDDLVAEAAMLTRVDRKYVLPRADVDAVVAQLDRRTKVLEIDGVRAQAYRSTYFDTPDLRSFHQAAHPRRRRFKIRTRLYADTGVAFLEVKARGARGVTVKDRIDYPVEACASKHLAPETREWLAERLAAAGQPHWVGDHLEPVLWGGYNRTTLLLPGGAGRGTIDTDLFWADASDYGLDFPEIAVVETKSGSRPSLLDRQLWRHGYRPARISKFGTGMAALHPELPHNRWQRVLTSYFGCPAALSDPAAA